jgi:lipopolysaccharide biosynthesis glycosyltransferase
MIDWTPKDPDKAVFMACDRNFLPFASFLAWQVVSKSGPRDFDVVIVSEEELELPDVLVGYGVKTEVIEFDDAFMALPVKYFPRASYSRMHAADLFRSRYRRLLYLDCDMQFEGGDLSRLLELDLFGAALGAARDIHHAQFRKFHAPEYRAFGLPADTYFNSGLMLIDTAEWHRTEVVKRCLAIAAERHDFMRLQDQSVMNVALIGEFCELAPVWNWMMVNGHEPYARQMPIRINHFITEKKPFRAAGNHIDRRHREIYRDFFLRFAPDWISELPIRQGLQPVIDRKQDLSNYLTLLRKRKLIDAYLAPFKDEWTVLPPTRMGKTPR